MGEGMFAHQLRLARHKMKMVKTIVRKKIHSFSLLVRGGEAMAIRMFEVVCYGWCGLSVAFVN
ncbi:hypothetical protein HMPREF0670_02275 [Prevotella sp. oral taxon 317 str. F0108]|nr:hypothetical protein HMPREF0670_02275 [Prevotella sp. oral taxon 317 str. F0108]